MDNPMIYRQKWSRRTVLHQCSLCDISIIFLLTVNPLPL